MVEMMSWSRWGVLSQEQGLRTESGGCQQLKAHRAGTPEEKQSSERWEGKGRVSGDLS